MPRNKRPKQYRHWVITINYHDDEPHVAFEPEDMSYMVLGKEIAPTTGQKHLQGYVVFKTRRRRTNILKYFPKGAFLENMKGQPPQNIKYCKKEGDWTEWGISPAHRAVENATDQQTRMKNKWAAAYQAAKTGDLELIDESMLVRYYPAFKRIQQDNPIKPADLEEFSNAWIIAPTGYGKSRYARETWPDFYDKSPNKWFIGYKGQATILCDDFSPKQCEHLGWYMKRWADLYSFPMETKGGGHQIRPKRIVVTSQYTIDECFEDDKVQNAMHRRFETIYLTPWEDREATRQIAMLMTDESLDDRTATTVEVSSNDSDDEINLEELTFAQQNGYDL